MFRLSTDGAANPNPGRGGWAFHLTRPDGTTKVVSGAADGTVTSNQMEVRAVIEGLARVPKGAEVEVATDSKLVIGWLSGGWRRNNTMLRSLLKAADALVAARRVQFVKVRGHAGDVRNELVNAHAEQEARHLRRRGHWQA